MENCTESQAILALAALSQETRLRIVRFLVKNGPDGARAGDIGKAVDVTPSRLSFHLTNLDHAGLVGSHRQSRQIIYKVNFDRLGSIINFLLTDCCASHPAVMSCCDLKSTGK